MNYAEFEWLRKNVGKAEDAKKEDGYDDYIYVETEVSGEGFGGTFWLKEVKK